MLRSVISRSILQQHKLLLVVVSPANGGVGHVRQLAVMPGAAVAPAAGTIADLFTTLNAKPQPMEPRFAELKQRIAPPKAVLQAAWGRLEKAVEAKVKLARSKPAEDLIPIVHFNSVRADRDFDDATAAAIRSAGAVIIRGVVSKDQALRWKEGVREYAGLNPGPLGFPADNPQVYELYWSRPQVEARQHPAMLYTMTLLNRLWRGSADQAAANAKRINLDQPTLYCDRLRMRVPGDTSFKLGPHVDGGSIERWEDEQYRKVYASILNGNWEQHDAFDPTYRTTMKQDLYNTPNGCSAFRTFQGWLSLSDTGPTEGTLRLVPFLKEATAYFMLRPFLDDVPDTDFPGAVPRTSQDINARFHAPLTEAVISVPRVQPGDTVWWHCDGIHAVELEHKGRGDSSVFYIPSAPLCETNAKYLARQRFACMTARTPPDFPQNNFEQSFVGRAQIDDFSPAGRVAMGLLPFPADNTGLAAKCNNILGFKA